MKWIQAEFKGKTVWAAVHAEGNLVVENGRVPIRYSDKAGTKIYRAGQANIRRLPGDVLDLPEGVSADDMATKKRPGASGFGSAGKRTQAQANAAKQSAESASGV